jgi:thiol-disulfide isomerase/thioredoxin
MMKYYIAAFLLVVVLGLIYYKCMYNKKPVSNDGDEGYMHGDEGYMHSDDQPQFKMSSGGDMTGGSGVSVTYYFNPGCPHCRTFNSVWKDFTASGGANFIEINCSDSPDMCQGVTGVPTVVFSKPGSPPVTYSGNRDKDSLVAFLAGMN